MWTLTGIHWSVPLADGGRQKGTQMAKPVKISGARDGNLITLWECQLRDRTKLVRRLIHFLELPIAADGPKRRSAVAGWAGSP
jgi:hypothetical protein